MSSVANVSVVVCSFREEGLTLGALEIHFKRGGTLFFFFFLLLLNSQKDPEIRKNYQLVRDVAAGARDHLEKSGFLAGAWRRTLGLDVSKMKLGF